MEARRPNEAAARSGAFAAQKGRGLSAHPWALPLIAFLGAYVVPVSIVRDVEQRGNVTARSFVPDLFPLRPSNVCRLAVVTGNENDPGERG